jgi:hypothetical protein
MCCFSGHTINIENLGYPPTLFDRVLFSFGLTILPLSMVQRPATAKHGLSHVK